ncbi:hypothetical protein EYZ11_010887 [Aspergillus tanneri]|nr:hypothetical protein EYZ11_010887 [Aspergillus tanneri]
MLRDLLHTSSTSHARFEVLSNPEFLSEGTAISNLLNPSRVLIGCQQNPPGQAAADALATLYRAWIPPSAILILLRQHAG